MLDALRDHSPRCRSTEAQPALPQHISCCPTAPPRYVCSHLTPFCLAFGPLQPLHFTDRPGPLVCTTSSAFILHQPLLGPIHPVLSVLLLLPHQFANTEPDVHETKRIPRALLHLTKRRYPVSLGRRSYLIPALGPILRHHLHYLRYQKYITML